MFITMNSKLLVKSKLYVYFRYLVLAKVKGVIQSVKCSVTSVVHSHFSGEVTINSLVLVQKFGIIKALTLIWSDAYPTPFQSIGHWWSSSIPQALAMLSICFQEWPLDSIQSSVSLLQLLHGLPLYLFPWGFQQRACQQCSYLVFWVRPIHVHFLFLICSFKSGCLAIFHRVTLPMVTGQ